MRLLLASFKHETNTFSPVKTDIKRFFKGSDTPLTGHEALIARKGTGTGIGGFISVCEKSEIDFDTSVAADARPSGYVEDDAFELIASIIINDLKSQAYDGLLLDLHGAMVTRKYDDAEGELLRRIREVNSSIPVGVVMDMHANIYPEMIQKVDIATGYHTYPHVDIFEAGVLAADLLIKKIKKIINPCIYFNNKPMIPHIMRQGTHEFPNKDIQGMCIELEKNKKVLAASVFTGFPHADIQNAGLSAVVITDENPQVAKEHAESLLNFAWENRDKFNYKPTNIQESFDKATSYSTYPVIMLDHCDNVASGGTLDTTPVLKEAIERKLKKCVFFSIHDPIAVEQAHKVGVGNTATFNLGGKSKLEATKEENPSLDVTAKVVKLHPGIVKIFGPMMAGLEVSMGKTAVLQIDDIKIVVISGHQEPMDKSFFSSLDIDLSDQHFIIIKSRVHWRAGLGDVTNNIVECDSIGVTTSDYNKLSFNKLRRPIYPLDNI